MTEVKPEDGPKVIAVIPAFNEEHYIGTVVLKTRLYVDEVIVLDDGSTDQTAHIANLAGATVIQHERNRGYGASIQTLLAEAKRRRPNVLILLDADSQHDAQDIPHLIKPVLEGFDLVIGSRKHRQADIPLYRRIGQTVISFFSYILSREKIADSESGFRAFSEDALAKLELKERGMSASAEMIASAVANGLKIKEVPISVKYTKDGSTMNPVMHGFGVIGRILIMISERRPLFFFGIAGSLLVTLGVFAGIQVLNIAYLGGGLAIGTALLSALMIIIGLLSIFTGIILNVIARSKI